MARFECGNNFLDCVARKQLWPRAEPLATRWQQVMTESLGQYGAREWCQRARDLRSTPLQGLSSLSDKGMLRIKNIRAHRLRSAEIWDQPDPYVVFNIGSLQQQTSVVTKNDILA